MKIKCPYCNAEYVNNYHLAAAHTKAYHDLLFKIHEKIEEYDIADPEEMMVADVLKSLLEDDKK